LNQELKAWREFQPENAYTAQTLLLAKGKDFIIRANIWEPPASSGDERDWQNSLYYYLIPHDHNFSFMTVGYLGSGYETTLYERDPDLIEDVPGQSPPIRFVERTSLPQGKVMLYRAFRDIHRQEHPKEFSISLNLMLAQPQLNTRDQYFYDFELEKV